MDKRGFKLAQARVNNLNISDSQLRKQLNLLRLLSCPYWSFNTSPNAAISSVWFCLGCCLSSFSATLDNTLVLFLSAVCVALAWLARFFNVLLAPLCLVLGALWFSLVALSVLHNTLPLEYEQNHFKLTVKVIDFPRSNSQRSTFLAQIVSLENLSQPNAKPWLAVGQKIRLSCYRCEQLFVLGDSWQLQAKLRSMHSLQSWDAVDFERQALVSRITARGTIIESSLLPVTAAKQAAVSVVEWIGDWVNYSRTYLRQRIITVVEPEIAQALLLALAIGDRSQFDQSIWQVLTVSGLSHLMAISGLHIGLIFFFSRFVIRRCINLVYPIYSLLPAIYCELLLSLAAATFYAALAGFALSTQRALLMLSVYCALQFSLRTPKLMTTLLLTVGALLLIDPLNVLSAGFWLSVGAVAIMAIGQWLRELSMLRVQLWLSIGMLPIVLFFIGQVSLLSPLINLLAVPFVTWLVLPAVLILMLSALITTASFVDYGLIYIGSLLEFSWHWLVRAVDLLQIYVPMSVVSMNLSSLQYVLLMATVLCCLCWRIITNQILCCLTLGLLWLASLPATHAIFDSTLLNQAIFNPAVQRKQVSLQQGEFNVIVFDVGQGLAVAIETPLGVTLYDAGNRYLGAQSSALNDSVQQIVLPYLRQQRVERVERVIISHHDLDHIGGLPSLLTSLNVKQLLSSDWIDDVPLTRPAIMQEACQRGQIWHEQGVTFRMLAPMLAPMMVKVKKNSVDQPAKAIAAGRLSTNNRSCVLHISSAWGSVLLPGDIERTAEHALLVQASTQTLTSNASHALEEMPSQARMETVQQGENIRKNESELAADVLILPHHGSRTSSSPLFLRAVKPSLAIASAGYLSRHGHPHSQVLSRLHRQGVKTLNTAYSGSVKIRFLEQGLETIEYRAKHPRFWYAKHPFY